MVELTTPEAVGTQLTSMVNGWNATELARYPSSVMPVPHMTLRYWPLPSYSGISRMPKPGRGFSVWVWGGEGWVGEGVRKKSL